MTLLITNEDVEKILTHKDCVDAMEAAFLDLSNGNGVNRARSHTYTEMPAQTGEENRFYMFKSMDGALPRFGFHCIRMSSDMISEQIVGGKRRREKLRLAPGNKYVGLVVLFDMAILAPVAIIQDGLLQQMRVGATSAVAAKYFARPNVESVGIIGTGNQARTALPSLFVVFPGIKRVKVYSITPEHRQAYAKTWSEKLGIDIKVADTAQEMIDDVDLLACTTNSQSPVLDFSKAPAGIHINSVHGAELDDAVYQKASVIGVREKSEPTFWWSGDKVPWEAQRAKSIKKGDHDVSKIRQLGDIISKKATGRVSEKDITLFTGGGGGGSAGLGTQFLAVAAMIYKNVKEKGGGYEIPTDLFCQTYKP